MLVGGSARSFSCTSAYRVAIVVSFYSVSLLQFVVSTKFLLSKKSFSKIVSFWEFEKFEMCEWCFCSFLHRGMACVSTWLYCFDHTKFPAFSVWADLDGMTHVLFESCMRSVKNRCLVSRNFLTRLVVRCFSYFLSNHNDSFQIVVKYWLNFV